MKGLHEEARAIYCNKCGKLRDKHSETIILGDHNHDVFCMWCFNWLCGFFDAFGYQPT
jgi:hypothetical protein